VERVGYQQPEGPASSANGKVRLLQVVESLDTGAVENWLYRMFAASTAKGSNYHWTFFCTLETPGRLDDKVRRLGGEVIHSQYPLGEKRSFFFNLRQVIRAGHYDVLHCHHDFVSAVYLSAALGSSVRKRIVHVHNTDEGILTPSHAKQLLLKEPMRQACLRLADNIVGISNETLNRFTHRTAPKPGRDRVVYYGIDTTPFHQEICTREQFRLSLGLAPNARVLLFTGRMAPLKNPCFVVEVLAELVGKNPDAVAVFAGAGELERRVSELAEQKGLADKVRVLGWRDDTAVLMRLCDLLVFPRLEEPKEGLGLVLVEAQAAGLPVLASPSMTDDVQVIPELFTILPLVSGPYAWAEAASRILSSQQLSRELCVQRVESSHFSLDAGIANLLALYADIN
jgi:glycosyltransferase involved in cell wall biosynthesis